MNDDYSVPDGRLPAYEPSGDWGPSWWFWVGVAGASCVGVAAGYQAVIAWQPQVAQLGLVAFLAMVLVLGHFAAWTIDLGLCRNRRLALGAALGLSLIFVLASHSWSYAFRALEGESLGAFLARRVDEGFSFGWTKLSDDKSAAAGIWVPLAWTMEAAGLSLGAYLGMDKFLSRRLFCEACHRWIRVPHHLEIAEPTTALYRQIRCADSPDALVDGLDLRRGESGLVLYYSLEACVCDAGVGWLTIDVGKTGRGRSAAQRVWTRVCLDRAQVAAFHTLEARMSRTRSPET